MTGKKSCFWKSRIRLVTNLGVRHEQKIIFGASDGYLIAWTALSRFLYFTCASAGPTEVFLPSSSAMQIDFRPTKVYA
jgi:hypothetical protein